MAGPPPGGSAHGLSVGAVGSELEGDGAEHAQLGGHLLHPPETSLLLRVSKFHHQAGRGTLGTGRTCGQRDSDGGLLPSARGTWLTGEGSGHRGAVRWGDSHPTRALCRDAQETRRSGDL